MTIDPSAVARYADGSRVPGWDDAADLDEGPAGRPGPGDDRGARRTCAPRSRREMAKYPEPQVGDDPRAEGRAALHGWCSPEGVEQAACVMRADARLPRRRRDVLRHVRHAAARAHSTSTCARTSPARCAARTSSTTRSPSTRGEDPDVQRARVRVPRRLRHRADGLGRRRRTSGRSTPDDVPTLAAARSARRRGAAARASRSPRRASVDPQRPRSRLVTDILALRGHRRARPHDDRRLRAPRRLRVAAQGARRRSPRSSSRRSRAPACAAAAAPASRWARRRRSCPRATWTSTSSCNADESEPGTFKDRELMQKNPHQLIEGIDHRRVRRRRDEELHLHPRRVRAAGRHPRRGDRRGLREGLPRREHPRLGLRPRRCTSRGAGAYICGEETGAARLARGQARQPAPEAAVPGERRASSRARR